uniref:WAP domain-containing protein n=1 Tax=Parascaris univalens TaxID=6257 RepID=A0A915CFU2_PARUN
MALGSAAESPNFLADVLDQYCPRGWAVKRIGKEYAAMTCEPTDPSRKCPKPYTCVASHCQINFCCANQKLLERLASEEENEENDGEEWAEDEL